MIYYHKRNLIGLTLIFIKKLNLFIKNKQKHTHSNMSSTLWKKALVDHLINTTKSVNVMLRNQQIQQIVRIPHELNTIEEIDNLSRELNNAIKFPYLRYMTRKTNPYFDR